jgi:hypothetical protein
MEEMSTAATTSVSPKHETIARVNDFKKASWIVREVRGTEHGFDLCFGIPRESYRSAYRGSTRLILTKGLRDYWYANRGKTYRFFLDLPLSLNAVKQALRSLRFYHRDDILAFWRERINDLDLLPTREFAAKHGVEPEAAFAWRRQLLKRGRPAGWWRTPEVRKVLFSSMSLSEAGRELGIELWEVHRLRRLAKYKAQPRD